MKYCVIIPTYNNVDAHLLECIDSIMSQSYKNFEVNLWNDGSTDKNTLNILQFIKSKYPEIKLHDNIHVGITTIRNIAIQNADCDVIINCDCDDISFPERFKMQVEYFEKYKPDVLGCAVKGFKINKNNEWEYLWTIKHKNIVDKLYFTTSPNNWIIHNQTAFIKRSLFNDFKYYDGFQGRGGDIELFRDLFNAGKKIHNLQDVLLHYRRYIP